jgi:hypothetical protein
MLPALPALPVEVGAGGNPDLPPLPPVPAPERAGVAALDGLVPPGIAVPGAPVAGLACDIAPLAPAF